MTIYIISAGVISAVNMVLAIVLNVGAKKLEKQIELYCKCNNLPNFKEYLRRNKNEKGRKTKSNSRAK